MIMTEFQNNCNFPSHTEEVTNQTSQLLHKVEDSNSLKNFFKNLSNSQFCKNGFDHEKTFNEINSIFLEKYFKFVGNSSKANFNKNVNKHINTNDLKEKKLNEDENLFIKYSLGYLLIECILDQEPFKSKYSDFFTDCQYQYIQDELIFNLFNSTFKLYIDGNMNLFFKKTFNQVDPKDIDKESDIFSENISNFIVHIDQPKQKKQNNEIFMPYFPLGTLESFFSDNPDKKNVKLSNIDKIVIILEIATALKDLHMNDKYHGNLSSQFIYVNSHKDAYICCICYDKNKEKEVTRPKGPFYYHSPEYINENEDENNVKQSVDEIEDEEFLKKQKLIDIYSFGVLIYEIITEYSPISLFGNEPRKKRLEALKNNYFQFLFDKYDQMEDKNESDVSLLKEMKKIIEKCMQKNSDDRFSCFREIIDRIHETSFYQTNKEEIEYRFTNAKSSANYKCKIADLVESYFLGENNALTDILKLLNVIKKDPSYYDNYQESEEDIIETIFEAFEIYSEENDESQEFSDIFNMIIRSYFMKYLNKDSIIDEENYLYSLSKNLNKNGNEELDLMIPIFNLGNFMKTNEESCEQFSLMWSYFIAKELSLIHSQNLFHGEISADTIGIYYNKETKTFIPSLLLYYAFYKDRRNCIISSIQNKYYSSSEFIDKHQRKDMKQFIKIISKMNGITDEILGRITEAQSMNEIVYLLYNFNIKSNNEEQRKVFIENYKCRDYSAYKITYNELKEIFFYIKDNFSIEDLLIDFNSILGCINIFLDNSISNPENIMKDNISIIGLIGSNAQNEKDITNQFTEIRYKSITLIEQIQNHKESTDNQVINSTNDQIKEKIKIQTPSFKIKIADFSNPKKDMTAQKIINLAKKEVFRYIEFSGMFKRSSEFLFKRYVYNLNPFFVYKITIKLNNQKSGPMQTDSVNMNDIRKWVKNMRRKRKEPESQNGCIIVTLDAEPIELNQ